RGEHGDRAGDVAGGHGADMDVVAVGHGEDAAPPGGSWHPDGHGVSWPRVCAMMRGHVDAAGLARRSRQLDPLGTRPGARLVLDVPRRALLRSAAAPRPPDAA